MTSPSPPRRKAGWRWTPRRALSVIWTTRKSRRSARAAKAPPRNEARPRTGPDGGGAAGGLRRRGARRPEAGARAAHQGFPRAGAAAAAGEALRARALYRREPGGSVPPRAHRGGGGRHAQCRREEQDRGAREAGEGTARGVPARVDFDARHHHAGQGDLRAGEGRPQPLPREEGQLHGAELRRDHLDRRGLGQAEGAGAGRHRRVGRAGQRAPTGGGTTKMKTKTLVYVFGLWLAAFGVALAQQNSIESFEVTQAGGKTVVRVTTKEPLRSVPPNFAVANPARIAFDFPNTVNALGRSAQDIGQGDLRSMNVVQGTDRTRLVLNLRRSVAHEAAIDGRNIVVTLSEPAAVQPTPGGQVARFAEGRADTK